jgi:hypothetical protein
MTRLEMKLRKFFSTIKCINELETGEIDRIVDCAKTAIKKGEEWGIKGTINYDTKTCKYSLKIVELCVAEHSDFSVERMLAYAHSIK